MDQNEIRHFSASFIQFNTKMECGKQVIYVKPSDGVFDFIDRYSNFLMMALSKETMDFIPPNMFDFNLDILPALINFIDYGSNSSYIWLETMIYNFNKVFRVIWQNKDFKTLEKELIWPFQEKKNNHSVIPRSNNTVICGQCKRKSSKGSKLFPLCFQGSDDPSTYPKEIAVTFLDPLGQTKRRGFKTICNVHCFLEAMAHTDKSLHEIVVRVPQILASRVIDKATFMDMGYAENIYPLFPAFPLHSYNYLIDEGVLKMISKSTEKIASMRIRTIVDSVYPEGRLKVVDNKIKICAEHETRKVKNKEADMLVKDLSKMKKREELPECVTEYLSTFTSHSDEKKHLLWEGHGIHNNIIKPEDYMMKKKELCIDFKLDLKICYDEVDTEERKNIETAFKSLKQRTLRLFPLKFVEQYIEVFKREFHKGFISGISKNDRASIIQALNLNSPVLGIWEDIEDEENQFVYIIACRTENSVVAMIPKNMDKCLDFLLQVFQNKISKQLLNNLYCLWKLNFIEALKVVKNDENFKSLPEDIQNNFISILFAFGKVKTLACRKKYEGNIQLSGNCDIHFKALHTMYHDDDLNKILYHSQDNSLKVSPPSHLSNCAHNIVWSGNLFIAEDDLRFRVSAWAYSCNSTDSDSVSLDLIKDLQIPSIEVMILSRKETMFIDYDAIGDNQTIIYFEIGNIPRRIVKLLKNPKCLAISCLNNSTSSSKNTSCSTIKTILRYFYCQSGKIFAKVLPPRVQNVCQELIPTVLSEMAPSAINFTKGFATLEEDIHKKLIDRHLNTNSINQKLRPLNARCLWTGEMQCIIREQRYPVIGFGVSKKLMEMEYDYQALITLKDEDFGAIKNGPINPSPGHYVYSNYVAITPAKDNNINQTLEEFFRRGVESGVALVAMNVERRVVDNIMGSYRKCHSVMVHTQDGHHITQELRLEKRIMLAFFLKWNERVNEVLRTGAEYFKQFCILRYDDQTNKLAIYFPKEKDKMLQVWKSICNGALMTFHEKMFKKLKVEPFKRFERVGYDVERKEGDEEGQQEVVQENFENPHKDRDEPIVKSEVNLETREGNEEGPNTAHQEEIPDVRCKTNGLDFKAKLEDEEGRKEVLEKFVNLQLSSEDVKIPKAQTENSSEDAKISQVQTENSSEDAKIPLAQTENSCEDPKIPLAQTENSCEDPKIPQVQTENNSDAEIPLAQAENTSVAEVKKKICWNCHATAADLGARLLKCSSCRMARYCDAQCQEDDWDRHKELCGKVREFRRQREDPTEIDT